MELDRIMMSQRELHRLPVIEAARAKRITQVAAAECLGISERQVRRLTVRLRQEGPRGLGHRGRGRPSNHRYPAALQQRVLALMQARYPDFGPTLACEKLAARHRIPLSDETLRQWMRQAGPVGGASASSPASPVARAEGLPWGDGPGRWLASRLVGRPRAGPGADGLHRRRHESGLRPLLRLRRHAAGAGQLCALRASLRPAPERLRRPAHDLPLPGEADGGGRAGRTGPAAEPVRAGAGRRGGLTPRAAANRFLARYLPAHNRRFRRVPRDTGDLHRPLPAKRVWQRILAIRERHALRHDNTVQHATKTYLLEERWHGHRPTTLHAEERLDGKLYLLEGDRPLRYREVHERPRAVVAPKRPPSHRRVRIIPAADHPWRQFERVQRLKALKNRTLLSW